MGNQAPLQAWDYFANDVCARTHTQSKEQSWVSLHGTAETGPALAHSPRSLLSSVIPTAPKACQPPCWQCPAKLTSNLRGR